MEVNYEDLVYDMIAEALIYPYDSNAAKYYNELIQNEKYGWVKELHDKIKEEKERIASEDDSYKNKTATFGEIYGGDVPVIASACAELAVNMAIENIRTQSKEFTL